MKAVKKPIPITVEEFRPDRKPWPMNVQADDSGLNGREYFVWNQLHGSRIGLKPGDYVNVSDPADTYPIDSETFNRTYDVVEQ